MTALPPLMSAQQVAEHLGTSRQSVYDLMDEGVFGPKESLPKLGRQYRIPGSRVGAFCRGDLEGAKA